MTLPELRALLERATPGPWRTQECSAGGLILLRDCRYQTHLQVVPEADAALIAAAVNALPALLDAVEAAERLRKLDAVKDDWDSDLNAARDAFDAAVARLNGG